MFRYVLVGAHEHPSVALGQAPRGLLSPREEALLEEMEFVPRRRKWLLGRAAAKALVRAMVPPPAPPPARISVLNRPSGEPFVLLEDAGEWERPVSLSHRSEVGLAAAPAQPGLRIGADVETIEPRTTALVSQFFTESEAEIVREAHADADAALARIWSAKEAVLKLLGVGLRLDTRSVVVGGDGPELADCPAGWSPLAVSLAGTIPGAVMPSGLRVVWRSEAGHVLTVACAA